MKKMKNSLEKFCVFFFLVLEIGKLTVNPE